MGSEKKERKGKKKLSNGFTSAIASPAHNYLRLDYVSCKRSNMSHFRAAYPLDYTLSRPPTPSILRRTAVASRAHPADTRYPRRFQFAITDPIASFSDHLSASLFPKVANVRKRRGKGGKRKGRQNSRNVTVVVRSGFAYGENVDKNFRTICRNAINRFWTRRGSRR